MANPSLASISSLLDTDPAFTSLDEDKPDDDEKKRRREMIRKLVGKVLAYHGLPEALTAVDVAKNSTLATALTASDGSYAGLQRRVKVKKTLIPPGKRHSQSSSSTATWMSVCYADHPHFSYQAQLLRPNPRY